MSGYKPRDFPQPTDADLDFDDPPDWLTDSWNRIFWCLNKNVRNKILQNREGVNGHPILFCVFNGFCTFHVNHIAPGRMNSHFSKHPTHRIDDEDYYGWRDLANKWKDLRDDLLRKRRHEGHRGSPPQTHRTREDRSPMRDYDDRHISHQSGPYQDRYSTSLRPSGYHSSRYSRDRSPLRAGNYENNDYRPRGMTAERSPSKDYRRRDSPISYDRDSRPLRDSRSPDRFQREYRSSDRYLRDSRSPDRFRREYRSPSRFQRDSRSPIRFQRDSRSPTRFKRETRSPDRYLRESRSPTRYSRSPSKRSRSPGFRVDNVSAAPSFSGRGRGRGHHFQRHYSSTPGPVGRFNSKMGLRPSEIPKPVTKVKEWVCQNQGIFQGCFKIFHDQIEFNEHVKIRNLSKTKVCPMKKQLEVKKKEEQKEEGVNVKREFKGYKNSGPPEEISLIDSPDRDRGVSPPVGGDSISVRSDGVLMVQDLPHAAPTAASSLPDIITSSKPPASGLRLPVVNRSNSPPASFPKRVSSTQEVRRSRSPPDKRQITDSSNQTNRRNSLQDTNANVQVDKTSISRRSSHEAMTGDSTSIFTPSPSSSNSKETTKDILTKRKENKKFPPVLNDKEISSQPSPAEGNTNRVDKNAKEVDDMELLLDKRVVRKQQLSLLNENKKKRFEKLTETSSKQTLGSASKPVQNRNSRGDDNMTEDDQGFGLKRKSNNSIEHEIEKIRKTTDVDRFQQQISDESQTRERKNSKEENITEENEKERTDCETEGLYDEDDITQDPHISNSTPNSSNSTHVVKSLTNKENITSHVSNETTDQGVGEDEIDEESYEQFELAVASIVREREENQRRASVDSNISASRNDEEKIESSKSNKNIETDLNKNSSPENLETSDEEAGDEIETQKSINKEEAKQLVNLERDTDDEIETETAEAEQLVNPERDENLEGEEDNENETYEGINREEANILRLVEKEVDGADFSNDEEENEDPDRFSQVLELLEREEAESEGPEKGSSVTGRNTADEDESDSDQSQEDEEDEFITITEDEFILYFGNDACDSCPKCGRPIEVEDLRNISVNIRTGATIVYCDNQDCQARIEIRNLLGERQKTYVYCGM